MLLVAAALLLWPAVYNRFPLVFPDTGAYLSVSWARQWTIDRSGFYGFYFKMFSWMPASGQLWLGTALQSLAIAGVLLLSINALRPSLNWYWKILIVAALSLLTSLAWHSSQLLPDALTGATILLAWLGVSRNPSSPGAPLLWLGVTVAGLMHYTHIALIPLVGAAALVGYWIGGLSLAQLYRRGLAAAAVTLTIVAIQIGANGYFLHQWKVAPVGSVFLFARMHEDGLTDSWLDRRCSTDKSFSLCKLRGEMPRDSQVLLWDEKSPLHRVVWSTKDTALRWRLVEEMSETTRASLLEESPQFLALSMRAALAQFRHFAVMDDECPEVCGSPVSALYSRIRTFHPELLPALLSSRQMQNQMPKALFRSWTTPIEAISMLALLPLIAWAFRRKDGRGLSLLLAVAVALAANAALTGALSDVHDRYQSRVAWLASFAVLVVTLRLLQSTSRPSGMNQLGIDEVVSNARSSS